MFSRVYISRSGPDVDGWWEFSIGQPFRGIQLGSSRCIAHHVIRIHAPYTSTGSRVDKGRGVRGEDDMGSATISVDEFMALEQKVLLTVELIKKEREAKLVAEAAKVAAEAAKATLEAELAAARAEESSLKAELSVASQEISLLREQLTASSAAQSTVDALQQEREAVRVRVEKMLADLDELL